MAVDRLKSRIIAEVDAKRNEICDLSRKIHDNPELGFHEYKASEWLTQYLEKNGFRVERGILGLETAFRAGYGQGPPVIALLAEYDALPDLGHACGHNIIAASSTGAGIAARLAVDEYGGTVLVIGTPAEELYGGKVTMAQKRAFDGLDAAMMVHPGGHNSVVTEALACQGLNVEFFGKASHAAGRPESGINALEALIQSYNAINSLRQHIRSKARIHGIITDGGQAPNVVPAHSAASFLVRADTEAYLEELKQKVLNCFIGAATATGARLEYKWDDLCYAPMLNNIALGRLFMDNMQQIGRKMKMVDPDKSFGSTDFGNVSQLVPGIHATIAITNRRGVVTHSPQFAEAAISEKGLQAVIDAAKALAMTAADLLAGPEILVKIQREFQRCR
ncbi:MAG: M20 family metallopeptidase [Dehalococcoidales bacterium]|nr:M20 family metallopeptidase [Dehalococcoidales bacterium]